MKRTTALSLIASHLLAAAAGAALAMAWSPESEQNPEPRDIAPAAASARPQVAPPRGVPMKDLWGPRGVRLPSADKSSRAVELDQFPIETIRGRD